MSAYNQEQVAPGSRFLRDPSGAVIGARCAPTPEVVSDGVSVRLDNLNLRLDKVLMSLRESRTVLSGGPFGSGLLEKADQPPRCIQSTLCAIEDKVGEIENLASGIGREL